jgi:four helix bundle protein
MFLQLSHTKLNVYAYANELIVDCYTLIKSLPAEERYNLSQQIKRAALSVKLNIAEGVAE